jgi:mycoredoxin
MKDEISVYGAPDCKDTTRTRRHLDALDVPHRYIDVEQDERAAEQVKRVNDGKRMTPTVVIGGDLEAAGAEILAVPSDTLLDAALERHGRLPHSDSGDGSPGLRRG